MSMCLKVVDTRRPADGLIVVPENTVVLGGPKLTRLNALKNSARNCSVIFSDTTVSFNSDKSTSASPGPVSDPLPTSPKVPKAGSEKAFGLNHSVCLPTIMGPEKLGFTDGRSGILVSPSPDRFDPTSGVNGNPLKKVLMPFSCQPPMNLFPIPPVDVNQRFPGPKGSS